MLLNLFVLLGNPLKYIPWAWVPPVTKDRQTFNGGSTLTVTNRTVTELSVCRPPVTDNAGPEGEYG